MLKKIVIFIVCLSMIFPSNIEVVKASDYVVKYLTIKRINDNESKTYEIVVNEDKIYIGLTNLIDIVEFDEKTVDMTGDTINQIILTKNIDSHGYDQNINIFPKEKIIESAWYGKTEFDGCLNFKDEIYLDLIKIFNYLRVKGEVIEDELWINIPVYSILDFMIYDHQSVLYDSVSQLDLLKTQETSFSSGFIDALCLACNNFDLRLLIPVWGSNEIKNDQYIKAIQTLNEDNEVFYQNSTKEQIKKELYNRGFEGILTSGKDLANVMSIGGKTVETVEDYISGLTNVSDETIKKYMELVNWNGENFNGFIEMRAWNKYATNISDMLTLADIVISAYEAYSRAKSWNQESLDDLEVLQNLNIKNYGEHKEYVRRIKKNAEALYKESTNASETACDQAIQKVFTTLLEKVITETSVSGKIIDYFILAVNTGVSVAKCFGNIAEDMDKAELSYMVTCLINIAVATRIDAEIKYDMLDLNNLQSKDVDEYRKSMKTAIKSNLRCWSYIYYLNCDGKWEKSFEGKDVVKKINKMNTYLTLLNESQQYDYALDSYDIFIYSPKKIIEILKESPCYQFTDIISSFPLNFTSASGGGWLTNISIEEDGTFTGKYHSTTYGDSPAEYICNFTGKFSGLDKINEYTYKMQLESMECKERVGEEYYIDQRMCIGAEPYGLEVGKEFILYLPGCNTSDLPSDFLGWVSIAGDVSQELPFYGIYNIKGKHGFFSDIYEYDDKIDSGEVSQENSDTQTPQDEIIEVSGYLDSDPAQLLEIFQMQPNDPWQFGSEGVSYIYDDFAVEWMNSENIDYTLTSASLGKNTFADDPRFFNISLYGILRNMTGEECSAKLDEQGYKSLGYDETSHKETYAKNENGKRYVVILSFFENQLTSWYWNNWREGDDFLEE